MLDSSPLNTLGPQMLVILAEMLSEDLAIDIISTWALGIRRIIFKMGAFSGKGRGEDGRMGSLSLTEPHLDSTSVLIGVRPSGLQQVSLWTHPPI